MGRCGAFVNTNDELMELMASGQTPVVAPTVENAGGGGVLMQIAEVLRAE